MQSKRRPRKRVRKRSWSADDVDEVKRERPRMHRAEVGETCTLDPADLMTDCTPNAIVVSPYGVLAYVERDGEEILCKVDDSLTDGKTSFLAPGDNVVVEGIDDDRVITAVARRTSRLGRPALEKSREQVIAANIDLMVIVVASKKPAIKPGLIDRYLVAAEMGGVDAALCVNKMDLVSELPPKAAAFHDIGVPVYPTSCETGEGLDELHAALQGKLSVLAGHSGVGKSSIVNALLPDADIATQEVSHQTEKGKHTTTASRLFTIDETTRIIDTPGIKQLGLWNLSPDEVSHYFPDFAAVAGDCKFRDCTHEHEPDCAVRAAVEAGTIQQRRYDSYLRIRESL